ncbi:sensor histidine kinase [Microbispora sp. CA-102843]|uniref:sensor histidine kinase n=1 Tax=Microbispora sp. CA-102843 TaxID=3239952 RepID=UPI003D925951
MSAGSVGAAPRHLPDEVGLPSGEPTSSPDRAEGVHSWRHRFASAGPYILLGLGAVLAAASAEAVMDIGERYVAAVLAVAALALQLWWSLNGRRRVARGPAHRLYYLLRWALGFALSWCNPIFAVYAVLGYYDAGMLLPRHLVRPALFATAITMAGSNIGGLPPAEGMHWLAFIALLALHSGLAIGFDHIAVKESEHAAELRSANNRLARALQENAGLHAQLLLQAREAGVADERRRLAAEIHDTLAQGLTGIVTQLQAATDSTDPAGTRDHIERASVLARHSLREARRSVQNLSPGQLEHDPLSTALEKIVAAWSAQTGVRAEITVTGTIEPLHHEVEATLLRIAQEALANVGRHAGAQRTGVTLSYMDDEVSLDVRDDGNGFDPRGLPPRGDGGGFGLGGMRARAERVAGTIAIESEPGLGTALSARVPLVRHE